MKGYSIRKQVLRPLLFFVVCTTCFSHVGAQQLMANEAGINVDGTVDGTASTIGVFPPSTDGWHRWEVKTVDRFSGWCCTSWGEDEIEVASCSIDPGAKSYTRSRVDTYTGPADNATVQIYARVEDGAVESIQIFGQRCEVTTKQALTNYNRVDASTSLRWLESQLADGRKVLGAIAVHDVVRAQTVLERAARSGEMEQRKEAIFWMGQVRAIPSRAELIRLMKQDRSREIREHAVFSVSQSKLSDRLDLIEVVAINDREPKVRGQAWFWMAQSEETGIETRIRQGMQVESNKEVLVQAVFALSQLKGGDSVNALIGVVEDQNLSKGVRKQALFWLGQDGSETALAYLSSVLER